MKRFKPPSGRGVRGIIRSDSTLRAHIQNGLGGVAQAHLDYFDKAIRSAFTDSLDLDAALLKGREQENRWDYLLGVAATNQVIGVEPHSAKQDQLSTLIKKKRAALDQLRGHLVDGGAIAKWLWVASGKVHFAHTEKISIALNQNGIQFVGRRIFERHLR